MIIKKGNFQFGRRNISKYDLQNINDGEFWKKVLDLEDEGERIFTAARDIEAKDIVKACNLIQNSTMKYDEITQLIDEKRDYIVKAKFKYRRVTFLNWLIGFVIGVVASIIATWIWENFIHI